MRTQNALSPRQELESSRAAPPGFNRMKSSPVASARSVSLAMPTGSFRRYPASNRWASGPGSPVPTRRTGRRSDGSSPLNKEPHRFVLLQVVKGREASGLWERERWDGPERLSRNAERDPARREDTEALTSAQQDVGELRASRLEMFAVVQRKE